MPPVEVIMTAHGEQRQMPLQDGSRLHVNTETRLILDFSGSERRAILDKGEAFFEVARDARRPFVVVVGNSEVRVLGTKFNVHKNEHGVSVVVSEGRVAVQPNRKLAATTMPQSLIAGQKLLLDEVSHQMTISTIDAEMATAWRSGQLYFDAAPLEQVVMDVNRYSRKQFVIEGPALKGMRLSGNFRAGDIESVQFALRDAFAIQSQEQGDKIVLRAAQAKTPG
jgi:transmembrane sensor